MVLSNQTHSPTQLHQCFLGSPCRAYNLLNRLNKTEKSFLSIQTLSSVSQLLTVISQTHAYPVFSSTIVCSHQKTGLCLLCQTFCGSSAVQHRPPSTAAPLSSRTWHWTS